MSDNEIIKALEAHFEKEQACRNCPLKEDGDCCVTLLENAFDLINRQKAEIERLQTELVATRYSENAFKEENRRLVKLKKSEAIKEFAEKYEKAVLPLLTSATLDKKDGIYACLDILKEMAGDGDA